MPLGRPHHVVYDCPDPQRLGEFYSALLGLPITYRSAEFVVVAASAQASGWAFQRVAGHRRPSWPGGDVPQQVHLDVMVDDPDTARPAVLAVGAELLSADGHVYADPAGHPFCLIPRPSWAPPVG